MPHGPEVGVDRGVHPPQAFRVAGASQRGKGSAPVSSPRSTQTTWPATPQVEHALPGISGEGTHPPQALGSMAMH